MNKRSITLGVCVSSLLIGLLTQSPDLIALDRGGSENESPATYSATEKSELKLCDIARAITVKVLAGGSWGSGIIVQRQERRNTKSYTVLTNAHVLLGNSYQIQTPDGKTYQAILLKRFDDRNSRGDDLAILQFLSPEEYDRAILAPNASLRRGQKVLAAGFPVNPALSQPNIGSKAVCLWPGGIISLILDRPMREGYQIGYHIDIAQGMSGGPLLNEQGEVIGVNGKGDPLIFRNPDIYRYQDDNTRVQQPLSVMTSSSWAIPIETFVQQAPLSLELNQGQLANIPRNRTRQTPPPAEQQSRSNGGATVQNNSSEGRTDNHQGSLKPRTQAANPRTNVTPILPESEIKNKAEKITVLVSYSDKSSPEKIITLGAGVLVAQQGTTYYALTHKSVIPSYYYENQGSRFSVSYNQQRYELNHIRRAGTGLVLLQFTNNHNDEVALVGDARDLEENSNVYIAGWKMGQGKSWEFLFTKAEIISQRNLPTDYIVEYNNQTRGMKGGPVLDEKGMLVAIHKGEEGGKEGIAIDSLQVSLPEFYSLLTRQDSSDASITSEPRNILPQPKPWTNPPQQQLPSCSETLWGLCSQ
ncbi:MAG: serine protease [Hormoscilla sp.]